MAILESTANNTLEWVKNVVAFLTDAANFGDGNQWQLMRPATVESIQDEVILKPYKVFNNVFRRDNDDYFAIEGF